MKKLHSIVCCKKKFLVDLSYVYFIKKFKIRNIEISTNKRKGKPKVGSALKVNFKIFQSRRLQEINLFTLIK